MKLKFRASKKDLKIFGVFSVFLLYLCCLVVVNIKEVVSFGTLAGLNPFPAFLPENIIITIVIFLCALISILTSVSSHFFSREKGFGFTTDKKDEAGYSRWATEKEMQKELKAVLPNDEKSEYAGIPLINNGKKIWIDDGEYHSLIIGSTGAGKTEAIIQPMVKILAKKGESMIITDPKGEIYEKNANELKLKGYNIVLLNFRNPQNGNCWNPLALPYKLYTEDNKDKAIELLEDLALNIMYDDSKGQDPFWERTSADYFSGLSLSLFDDAKPEEINLNSINLMTNSGEDKIGNTTYIKEYFSGKDQTSAAYINVSSTIMAPNETKNSILSVFKQKIKLFSSRENLSEMLSHSDFDMKDIGRKKTAVFIVIQDEKKTYHSLVTIFLKQCYETLISVAQENGGKLQYRTNFILDEFANMPPLKDVTTMVTAARSRAIRFSFVIQNFAQLYQVYGKENGETIKGNCGNIVYLISSELAALEEISKLCGEIKSKEKDKTASRPLITVSDLQRLPQNTLIALRIRNMPFKTKLTPNWKMVEMNAWEANYEKASYPTREKQRVHMFDLKGYVDKKKDERMSNLLGSLNGNSSNNQGGGFNPFGNGMSAFGAPVNKEPAGMPGGFDVDEMVRRIDAKIAELEEEERLEKEKAEKEVNTNKDENNLLEELVSNDEKAEKENKEEKIKLNKKEEMEKEQQKVEVDNKEIIESTDKIIAYEPVKEEVKIPSKHVESKDKALIQPKFNPNIQKNDKYINNVKKHENYISDDQFFDDFFNEDD